VRSAFGRPSSIRELLRDSWVQCAGLDPVAFEHAGRLIDRA
jgi:hypothetical protein